MNSWRIIDVGWLHVRRGFPEREFALIHCVEGRVGSGDLPGEYSLGGRRARFEQVLRSKDERR